MNQLATTHALQDVNTEQYPWDPLSEHPDSTRIAKQLQESIGMLSFALKQVAATAHWCAKHIPDLLLELTQCYAECRAWSHWYLASSYINSNQPERAVVVLRSMSRLARSRETSTMQKLFNAAAISAHLTQAMVYERQYMTGIAVAHYQAAIQLGCRPNDKFRALVSRNQTLQMQVPDFDLPNDLWVDTESLPSLFVVGTKLDDTAYKFEPLST